MKQMQKMQRNMAQLQEELAKTPVEGTAGGGVVKVTVNGANQMLAIELAPEVVDPDDIEMLQDLMSLPPTTPSPMRRSFLKNAWAPSPKA